MFLGGALQLTNMYGDTLLIRILQHTKICRLFCSQISTIIMSILKFRNLVYFGIPFFLKRFGIKQVMLISMFAWFWPFAYGNP
jgi:NHS family xanthosine MFS transporter